MDNETIAYLNNGTLWSWKERLSYEICLNTNWYGEYFWVKWVKDRIDRMLALISEILKIAKDNRDVGQKDYTMVWSLQQRVGRDHYDCNRRK